MFRQRSEREEGDEDDARQRDDDDEPVTSRQRARPGGADERPRHSPTASAAQGPSRATMKAISQFAAPDESSRRTSRTFRAAPSSGTGHGRCVPSVGLPVSQSRRTTCQAARTPSGTSHGQPRRGARGPSAVAAQELGTATAATGSR